MPNDREIYKATASVLYSLNTCEKMRARDSDCTIHNVAWNEEVTLASRGALEEKRENRLNLIAHEYFYRSF